MARDAEERKGIAKEDSRAALTRRGGRNSKRGGPAVGHGGRLGAPRIGVLRRTSGDGKRQRRRGSTSLNCWWRRLAPGVSVRDEGCGGGGRAGGALGHRRGWQGEVQGMRAARPRLLWARRRQSWRARTPRTGGVPAEYEVGGSTGSDGHCRAGERAWVGPVGRAELRRAGGFGARWLSGRKGGVGGGSPDFGEWAESGHGPKRRTERKKFF
jgi:hypothetical protein